FALGENVATTPGKVIARSDVAEIIQYEPATPDVLKRPLLICPPWINKFYIMDLRENNSFVHWAVNEGHTVYVISWANPTPEYKNVGMSTYMKDGVLAAMDQIEAITGEKTINITGYCI
ncbi:poly-beta-hydroxybutyrate polymerase, partial [Mycobacterium tuberculosis]|nr:poly-beta-hydroxybutyrate polymerase [Mycobacterium tuberculosis]